MENKTKKNNKPVLPLSSKGSDEFETPKYAVDILLPYLKDFKIIWEPAKGKGLLTNHLREFGFNVIPTDDFFNKEMLDWDCIVTNPPFSLKDEFLKRCYELGKPFALLMPLTALEGITRQEMYKKFGIQIILPNRRINFLEHHQEKSSAYFVSAWFCFGLNLPKDLNFVELNTAHGIPPKPKGVGYPA